MKSVDELGISPTPWSVEVWQSCDDYGHYIKDCHNNVIANMFLWRGKQRKSNARLIAAEPDCYEALREAVVQTCLYCKSKKCEDCKVVEKWRATLAKASGEEEKE